MTQSAISDAQWRRLLEEQARQHARLFFRIAWRLLRDTAAAEDVCQQAMLRAWSERHTIGQPDRLRAWLTRTVVNGSLQVLRRRRVERQAIAQLPVRGNGPSPADATADGEALAAALADLPEAVRTVVILRVTQGLSGNEVRELLGMSPAAISRALHQGLDQLRGMLANDFSTT